MQQHFLMMADYNAWANGRLYRMARQLPEALYRREVGAYFKSLHGTLNHILVADLIWMWRLTGVGEHPPRLNAIVCDNLADLSTMRAREDQRIIDYVKGLSASQLDEFWEYRTLDGAPQRQRRRETLAHIFNHQTHHRGQAHAIVTMLGVAEPDSLDLLTLQRERRAAACLATAGEAVVRS
jgi:uncharacterized damage-inducible protein DinB